MLHITGSVQPTSMPDAMALIADRIRGEFREMPGLVLTGAQACRLWSLDMTTCTTALAQLIDTGFLCRRSDGAYCRATDLTIRPRMAKAGIQFIEIDRSASSSQFPASSRLANG